MSGKIALIEECLDIHNMNLAQFCEFSKIPRATFSTWTNKGEITNQGRLLLEKFIEVKKLSIKAEEYDNLKNSLRKALE